MVIAKQESRIMKRGRTAVMHCRKENAEGTDTERTLGGGCVQSESFVIAVAMTVRHGIFDDLTTTESGYSKSRAVMR